MTRRLKLMDVLFLFGVAAAVLLFSGCERRPTAHDKMMQAVGMEASDGFTVPDKTDLRSPNNPDSLEDARQAENEAAQLRREQPYMQRWANACAKNHASLLGFARTDAHTETLYCAHPTAEQSFYEFSLLVDAPPFKIADETPDSTSSDNTSPGIPPDNDFFTTPRPSPVPTVNVKVIWKN